MKLEKQAFEKEKAALQVEKRTLKVRENAVEYKKRLVRDGVASLENVGARLNAI